MQLVQGRISISLRKIAAIKFLRRAVLEILDFVTFRIIVKKGWFLGARNLRRGPSITTVPEGYTMKWW